VDTDGSGADPGGGGGLRLDAEDEAGGGDRHAAKADEVAGEAWKNIQDKTKAGDVAGVVPEAQKLVETSARSLAVPRLRWSAQDAAKPEIGKVAEFEAAARNLNPPRACVTRQAATRRHPGRRQTFGRQGAARAKRRPVRRTARTALEKGVARDSKRSRSPSH